MNKEELIMTIMSDFYSLLPPHVFYSLPYSILSLIQVSHLGKL